MESQSAPSDKKSGQKVELVPDATAPAGVSFSHPYTHPYEPHPYSHPYTHPYFNKAPQK